MHGLEVNLDFSLVLVDQHNMILKIKTKTKDYIQQLT